MSRLHLLPKAERQKAILVHGAVQQDADKGSHQLPMVAPLRDRQNSKTNSKQIRYDRTTKTTRSGGAGEE
jgi:hypothetical protein